MTGAESGADIEAFAPFVATLGRGPGKSRALTRAEARAAFALVLEGRADPMQVGAFLMLLRYRGEDAEEITGLVEAARDSAGLPSPAPIADLDWPSYGAGRTREAPWFLLAALALARGGVRVLMHGSNEFGTGVAVEAALAGLGIAACDTPAAVRAALARDRFAYWPAAAMAPALARLLGLRRLFGLRSPVNTVARLLNPGAAPAGVDGVFHPAYLDVHIGVAERMARPCLLVLKGGGGEAERNPAKPASVHVWRQGEGRSVLTLPPYEAAAGLDPPVDPTPSWPGLTRPSARPTLGVERNTPDGRVKPGHDDRIYCVGETVLSGIWNDTAAAPPGVLATIQATIALGLIATGHATPEVADAAAASVWSARL